MEVRILKVIRRMLCMCEPAWELLIRGLQLSCVLLFCAFLLLVDAGGSSVSYTHLTLPTTPSV